MNENIKFRVRGRMPSQEQIITHFFTLEELMNYAIPRSFIIESIDQYTGYNNETGNEVYAGDIIKYQQQNDGWNCIGEVRWIGANCFGYYVIYRIIENKDKIVWWRQLLGDVAECENIEIIGNVHDDPELLEASA